MDIIQSYANSRAGDRAGFFVVKERVVPGRERCIQFQKGQSAAGRASTPHSTADLLFFPCSALLFSAELPILRVFFAVFQFAGPPLQRFTGWGDASVWTFAETPPG